MAPESAVKPIRVLTWPDAASADWTLVQHCITGEEDACTRLVTDHQRMVYQLALHLLGDRQEALDLSQEVFLKVFRTLRQFRGQSTLRTWIYRIVVNMASNRQRWWRRRHRSQQVCLDDLLAANKELPEGQTASRPDRVLQQRETSTRVWRALDQLPFDQRAVVVLREIDGLSYEEIAERMACPIGTVRSRIFRAREAIDTKLRPLLTDSEVE